MQRRTAHIVTFGCQMNEADSEKMGGILQGEGYRLVQSAEEADVVVLNTCSIRAKAEHKAFSLAGRLREAKKKRPGQLLVMAGCTAQRWGETLLEKEPGLDVVIGTERVARLPALLRAVRQEGRAAVDVQRERAAEHPAEPVRSSRQKAWINIMFGCDNDCAYCVVPTVRGREWSRSPADILAEAAVLRRRGYREATLLGQNVNSYGRGLTPPVTFPELLRMLDGEVGIPRLRFTTSHPKDFSPELIGAIKHLPTVCEAVHLPLQAGGDEVLGRMNRGYTYEEYRRTYLTLREAVPQVSVTTDIIVGFPGETLSQYERTVRALEELRFDGIFSFCFSPREGTAAWELPDDIPGPEKRRRLGEVQALQREITEERNRDLIGKSVEVLVEGPSRKDGRHLTGRTRGNKIVHFPGPPSWTGRFLDVTIEEAGFVALRGIPASQDGNDLIPAPQELYRN